MSTRMQKIRLGIFMILAFLLLIGSIVTLAGLKLWNPRDRYFVRFRESISGLEVGSTVKMKGVRVGQVERIRIGKDVESVIVSLSLDPGTPVTRDTRAVLTSIGITGLQFVELTGGSARSERIRPNTQRSIIKAGSSTLQTLTGKATDIALKMEGVLNNLLQLTAEDNRTRVARLLDNTGKLAASWEKMASGNQAKIKRILSNVDRTTLMMEKAAGTFARLANENASSLKEALANAASAAKSLNRAVQDLNPAKTLKTIDSAAASLEKRVQDPSIDKALASLDKAASSMDGLINQLGTIVRQRDRQVGDIMRNLDRAADYLKDFSRSIKERPSLLLRGETRKERSVP